MATGRRVARRSIGAQRNPDSAEAIIEAAGAVLAEQGYDGFSIEAVARRARAGKQTIYRWWPSRAALLLDVYDRQKRDVEYPDSGDLVEDLARFLGSLLRVWRTTPSGTTFRAIIAEAQSDADAARALAEYARQRRERIARMVEQARARGELRADVDALMVADLLMSNAWMRLLTGRLDLGSDEVRRTVRLLVDGVSRRA